MTIEKTIEGTRVIVHMPDDMQAALAAYAQRLSAVLNCEVTLREEPAEQAGDRTSI